MIPDQYKSFDELTAALRRAGVEKSQLVVGVDFTASNETNGKRSFGGRSLHDVSDPSSPNPYMQALSIIAKALWDFDDDHLIPAYGFGDLHTGSSSVFSFMEKDEPCKGLVGCTQRYQDIAKSAKLAGPTSFAPLIRQAVKLVRETNEYHILVIVADGQVSRDHVAETTRAIVEASHYALSIVMVGVGDGPWNLMDHFDDDLPERRFDNFQFVEFSKVFDKYPAERREAAFATHALMEIPEQFRAIKRLGLLRKGSNMPRFVEPPQPCNAPDCSSPEDPWYGLPEGWDAYLDSKSSRPVYVNFALNTQTYVRPTFAKADARRNSLSSESTASTTSSGGHSRSTRSSASLSRYHARPVKA
jgi:E3 ubiquitin-protein ligase RGLG